MQPDRQPKQPLPAVQLAVVRRGEKPRLYHLEGVSLTLGSAEDVGLRLDDASVAPLHARLVRDAATKWQVVDLSSSSGTYIDGRQLVPEVVTPWGLGDTLRIGPFFMRWRPLPEEESADEISGVPAEATAAPVAGSEAQPAPRGAGAAAEREQNAQVTIAVEPASVTLEAGEQATIQVELHNQGSRVDHFTVDLRGLPREWVSTSHEFLRLVPGGRASLPVTIHPPDSTDTQPGEHAYRLVVISSVQETEVAAVEGVVTIPVIAEFEATLDPPRWQQGDEGRVKVHNQGNVPLRLLISGQDAAGEVDFGERQALAVAPGAVGQVIITPEARERPLLIRERNLPFTIVVRPAEGQVRELAGELVVSPHLSLGCLLLAAVPLVAVVVLLAGLSLGLIARELPGFGATEGFAGPLRQYIRGQWAEGLEINSLAGDDGVWLVVMGERELDVRQTWQARATFPRDFVEAQWQAGWMITDLSFGNGRWLLVMGEETEAVSQRWELARAFPEASIEAQMAEGYTVSDLAYGHGVWAVVMTRGGESAGQRWHLAPEFPEEFIRGQTAEGFVLSDVTYGRENWAVVMAQASTEVEQVWETAAIFPAAFVDQRWQEGYDISEVARGGNEWVVVMTRVPGRERRQTWQAAETLR